MKKSELLLQLAELKYPKGTKFICYEEKVSTGVFKIYNPEWNLPHHKNSIWRVGDNGMVSGIVYDSVKNKWAEIVTNEKPKKGPVFIIKSEDGVNLYSGMEMWGAEFNKALNMWNLSTFKGKPFILNESSLKCEKGEDFPYISTPSRNKAFSTKEAALNWIEQQNKPKEVVFDYPTIVIRVDKHGFSATSKHDTRRFSFESEDIKKISEAHASLQ